MRLIDILRKRPKPKKHVEVPVYDPEKEVRVWFRCPECGYRFEKHGDEDHWPTFGQCPKCGYPRVLYELHCLEEKYILCVFTPALELGRCGELQERLDEHRAISRHHAEIIVQRDDITNKSSILIQDLGSLNGTFVNGEELEKNEWRQLADGDCIRLGTSNSIQYVLHLPSEEEDNLRPENGKESCKMYDIG